MDIYWIQDKQRRGPATVPDVISLVQMGELTPDTLGWHPGCPQWEPLRELPALADFLSEENRDSRENETPDTNTAPDAPAPLAPAATDKAPVILAVGIAPTPLARLMARLLDTSLYCILALGLIRLSGAAYDSALLPGTPLFWLPMLLLEALLLSKWGTTPGKRLMGINLLPQGQNHPLPFGQALHRSFLAFILGVGMYIFPLSLLMAGFTGWRLKHSPITLWDARTRTLPVQTHPATPVRILTAVIIIYLAMNAVGYLLQPWMPDMLQEMEQSSPEAAKTLRTFMESALPAPPQKN